MSDQGCYCDSCKCNDALRERIRNLSIGLEIIADLCENGEASQETLTTAAGIARNRLEGES